DLNNLLTPVSTLLQLREETGVFDDELLPVAARNVSTMRAYIRDALFFSENLRPDIQIAELDELVRRAIDVARNARDKQVEIVSTLPVKVSAEVDSVQIERLIANLITNAIDASPVGGQVHIILERLAKTDEHRDWLRLRVVDHGEGISKENLSRVLTAYFSTKNRGDQNRGFGLGLAICRKIAALHGGSLTIESQLRKGATVQLDLPAHQIRAVTPIVPSTSQAA
ncbi:MAG TPA: ATP-binding protein, partial [Chthoniobacteraceae bacterium]